MATISASAVTAAAAALSRKRFDTYLSSSTSLFFRNHRAGLAMTSTKCSNRRRGMSCNCLFGLGVPELVVIAGVTALVFGPKQLPKVGRSLGKTVKSFQKAAKEFETELKKDGDTSAEQPTEEECQRRRKGEERRSNLEPKKESS